MLVFELLLLNEDWELKWIIIVVLGFDEECFGYCGVGIIGLFFEECYGENGIVLVLDEGGFGFVEVGNVFYVFFVVMEKGYVDVWFELYVIGGYSFVFFFYIGIGIMFEIVSVFEVYFYEVFFNKEYFFYIYM